MSILKLFFKNLAAKGVKGELKHGVEKAAIEDRAANLRGSNALSSFSREEARQLAKEAGASASETRKIMASLRNRSAADRAKIIKKYKSRISKSSQKDYAKPATGKSINKSAQDAANAKVRAKRKKDAEVDSLVRDLVMSPDKRLDKAARQLGSDKSNPVAAGKGLNAALPKGGDIPAYGGNGIARAKKKIEIKRLKKALQRIDELPAAEGDRGRKKIMARLFELGAK